MASVKKMANGKWRSRWRAPDGASREKWFDRKTDAEQHLTSVEHSKMTGAYVDPKAGKVTFKTFAERWRLTQVHRPSTAAQIETNLRRHVYPRLGSRPLGAIRPGEVQAFVKALELGDTEHDRLAPATIEVVYTWVSTIFRAAVTDRVIPVSPCQKIRRPEVHKARVEPLAVETVKALRDAVPHRYRAMIVFGAGTGARLAEVLGLTNDRVQWLERKVTIDRQLVRVAENGSPVFGPVKDRKNRPRTIPLPQTVVDQLSAHVARYGIGPEGLLFAGPRGGAVRRTTFCDMWRTAASPLGIPTGDGYHLLRHFYASALIRAGESVRTVQDRLGHASAAMTLDVYSHLWPEDEDRTRTAIDDLFAAAAPHENPTGHPKAVQGNDC